MPSFCPMGGRFPMHGSLMVCPDGNCRVIQFADTWEKKQSLLRRSFVRGLPRVCPKCGTRSEKYFENEPVCIATHCRVFTFSGGLIEVVL